MIKIIDNAEVICLFTSKSGKLCATLKTSDNRFAVNGTFAPPSVIGVGDDNVILSEIHIGDYIKVMYDDTRMITALYVLAHNKIR